MTHLEEVIEQSNKTIEEADMIAEFMGFNYDPENDVWIFPDNSGPAEELKYHYSWDWLMPVVDKIEMMSPEDVNITIEFRWCLIPVIDAGGIESNFDIATTGDSKFQAVYKAVVEFIKWYNEIKN